MILNLTLNLDLSQFQTSQLYDLPRALVILGRPNLAQEVSDHIAWRVAEDHIERRTKDPKRTISTGVWRDRSGRLREVVEHPSGIPHGLPWLVDNYYTVDRYGYVRATETHSQDLMEKVT